MFSPYQRAETLAARRWVCYDCRQIIRPRVALAAQERSWIRKVHLPYAARIGAPAFNISPIRRFTEARQLRRNGERSDDSGIEQDGTFTSPKEPFDQKVQRIVKMTRTSWNELVGYADIEKERKRVELQGVFPQRQIAIFLTTCYLEDTIEQKRLELQESRDAYRTAVDKHAMSLRESRDLLGRKDEWSESDAARFAALHTMVKTNEHAEYGTRQALQAAELGLEREIERLSSKIGAVYQAESMYNAKILQMKTWWTWALFLFNASVFVFNLYLLQVGLNPRSKRAEIVLADDTIKKLSSTLAEKVATVSNHADTKTNAADTSTQPEQALGPMSIQNGSVFYKEAEFEIKPSDTVSDIKGKIELIEGISSAKLRLVLDGTELEDARALEDFPADVEHAVEVFAVELNESDAEALGRSDPKISLNGTSLPDRVKTLFSDEQVSLKMRDITLTVLQSAFAGAAMASLVVIGLGRR
jgi:She9 / Mdm33 family/Ubiquitin family